MFTFLPLASPCLLFTYLLPSSPHVHLAWHRPRTASCPCFCMGSCCSPRLALFLLTVYIFQGYGFLLSSTIQGTRLRNHIELCGLADSGFPSPSSWHWARGTRQLAAPLRPPRLEPRRALLLWMGLREPVTRTDFGLKVVVKVPEAYLLL